MDEEKLLRPGAVEQLDQDPRTYEAEVIMAGVLEESIDWKKVGADGVVFDAERLMSYIQRVGKKQFRSRPWGIAYAQEIMAEERGRVLLKTENQAQGDNCVWQGWSKYGEVLNFVDEQYMIDFSSRFKFADYAMAYGAYIIDGGKSAKENGFAHETDVPSYRTFYAGGQQNYDMPASFFRIKDWNKEIEDRAKKYAALSYAQIKTRDIETVAKIMILNFGLVGGYYLTGMKFKAPKNIFVVDGNPKGAAHANYFGKITLEDGKITLWSKDSFGDWNGRGLTNGWLGHQQEELYAGMTFDWYTMIDKENISVASALEIEAAKKQLKFMDGRKTPYFQRVEAHGEAYKRTGDTFKYLKGIKCDLFDDLSREGFLVPISEVLWNKIKILEVK